MTRLSHFSDCVQCNQVCSLPALSNVTVTTARTQFLELGPAKYHRMIAWDLLPARVARLCRARSRKEGTQLKTRLTTFALVTAIALLLSVVAGAQKITSLKTTAKGQGTIVSDIDKHEISSVMVILKENGEADLTFYTDLQLSAQGTWSIDESPGQGINLKITGGVVSGNANGTGKLFLRKDGKSIDKLNIQATSADGSKVTVEFVADKKPKAK